MNITQILGLSTIIFFTSCAGGSNPGYLFHIIFIIIPLIFIGHYIHKRLVSSNESLYVLEGQLKRIITRLEKLEDRINDSHDGPESKLKKKKDKS